MFAKSDKLPAQKTLMFKNIPQNPQTYRNLGSIMRMRQLASKQSLDFRSRRNPVSVSDPHGDNVADK